MVLFVLRTEGTDFLFYIDLPRIQCLFCFSLWQLIFAFCERTISVLYPTIHIFAATCWLPWVCSYAQEAERTLFG